MAGTGAPAAAAAPLISKEKSQKEGIEEVVNRHGNVWIFKDVDPGNPKKMAGLRQQMIHDVTRGILDTDQVKPYLALVLGLWCLCHQK